MNLNGNSEIWLVIMKKILAEAMWALDNYSWGNLLSWLKHHSWNNLPTWHLNFLFSSLPKGRQIALVIRRISSVQYIEKAGLRQNVVPPRQERSKEVWVLGNLSCKSKLFLAQVSSLLWGMRRRLKTLNVIYSCIWSILTYSVDSLFVGEWSSPSQQPACLCFCPHEEHHCF